MLFPFEVEWDENTNAETFIDTVVQSLRPQALLLPKGKGFVPYGRFLEAYETLKRHTMGFKKPKIQQCWSAIEEDGLAFVVLRCIAGLSPPELARLASIRGAMVIDQGFARTWDRKFRQEDMRTDRLRPNTIDRLRTLIQTAGELIAKGAPKDCPMGQIHRLDKVDTEHGIQSMTHIAAHGAPYCVLLYERFLGRPFASHRDSVSEIVGDIMENAIEDVLSRACVSFRKTKRAERLPGFDQAPDFFLPDEFNPWVVIEAKITEDDGTARDKVTRVQHLAEISSERKRSGQRGFEVIACIDGAGFAARKSNLEKILRATSGKTFTLSTLDRLVECTEIQKLLPADESD